MTLHHLNVLAIYYVTCSETSIQIIVHDCIHNFFKSIVCSCMLCDITIYKDMHRYLILPINFGNHVHVCDTHFILCIIYYTSF